MSGTPHSHAPYGAEGSGFYSDNTIGCYNVIKNTLPMVMSALEKIPPSEGVFTICDYGTADGGTSMVLIHDVIAWLKEKCGESKEVAVLYEDQPINDFKSLFMRLNGLIPGPPSYFLKFKGVFVSSVGTGFYSQCVPSNTVDLGFSATAFHWLSKRPSLLTNILHHTSGPEEEEQKLYSAQSAEDWVTILLHRAAEMKPGSQFVLACFGVDNEGQFMGSTKNMKHSVYGTLTNIWKQIAEDGVITKEEFLNTTFNNYFRNETEFRAPFDDPNSAVSKAGLRLTEIKFHLTRCPYQLKWLAEGKKEDMEARRAHARWYIPTNRTWSNHTFISGLSDSRTAEEKAAKVDELFKRYEDMVVEEPEEHALDYIHAFISFEKAL